MTASELIEELKKLPPDIEVMRPGGEDPMANVAITHVEVGKTYNRSDSVAVVAKVKTKPVGKAEDSDVIAPAFFKRKHKRGCKGDLYRLPEVVTTDKKGRIGNGGWVTHVYVCNHRWDGCEAKVLVTERAVREIAVSVEVR